MPEELSYKKAGVDIAAADAAKRRMAESMRTVDARVLGKPGAFAALFDGRFPEYDHPVLVLKMEEPGSKQKLALQHGRVESIAYDLVNHLINDVIVVGAKPLAVQDLIVCGKLERPLVVRLVDSIAKACREQDCVLVGGETSEQPGVVDEGTYVLAASALGIVEKSKIIDGSRIEEGDAVLAVASNGLHTNGYSLVRALLAKKPDLVGMTVQGESFFDAILRPHKCYYQSLRGLFAMPELHGIAHITGGGIEGNLNRILPDGLDAAIDLGRIEVLPIFKLIRDVGSVPEADMLRTFNMGVGMTLVAKKSATHATIHHLSRTGCKAYPIGEIKRGEGGRVIYQGKLRCYSAK